jgi:nicotinamide-nucleotide amidase
MPDAIETLAARVGMRLQASGAFLATAESCTGGWVSQAVTAIAGSSGWFERGFVAYSNEAKQDLLGVHVQTIARHGAVSEETAREMARGALERSRAQVALAVTGIAGPSGGTAEKPVGLVCFAWARSGSGSPRLAAVRSETQRYAGDRERVRRQSVMRALEGVIELLDVAGAED